MLGIRWFDASEQFATRREKYEGKNFKANRIGDPALASLGQWFIGEALNGIRSSMGGEQTARFQRWDEPRSTGKRASGRAESDWPGPIGHSGASPGPMDDPADRSL